jgi:hypothetical protein
MSKSLNEEQRNAWRIKIHSQQKSGLSIQRWCQDHNIASHLFHYWKRVLFSQPKPSRFAELTSTETCTVNIEYKNIRIRLEADHLGRCLKILEKLAC